MAAELRAREPSEPLDVALGHALRAIISVPRGDTARQERLAAVLRATSSIQGRLIQEFNQERRLLEIAIAERTGRPVDDIFCAATARVATMLIELMSERAAPAEPESAEQAARRGIEMLEGITAHLRATPPIIPRLA